MGAAAAATEPDDSTAQGTFGLNKTTSPHLLGLGLLGLGLGLGLAGVKDRLN